MSADKDMTIPAQDTCSEIDFQTWLIHPENGERLTKEDRAEADVVLKGILKPRSLRNDENGTRNSKTGKTVLFFGPDEIIEIERDPTEFESDADVVFKDRVQTIDKKGSKNQKTGTKTAFVDPKEIIEMEIESTRRKHDKVLCYCFCDDRIIVLLWKIFITFLLIFLITLPVIYIRYFKR